MKQGLAIISPWKYKHASSPGFISERFIDFQKPFEVDKALHALRTRWTGNFLDSFLNSNRCEDTDLLSRRSMDSSFRDFSFIDLNPTRSVLFHHGTTRHIMLAAFNSDSVLNMIYPRKFNGMCCICGNSHGTFITYFLIAHISVNLRMFPCSLQFLTYRFGWISSDHATRDISHLEELKSCLDALWHVRHAPT